MTNRQPTPTEPSLGLSVGDIYYILFRHKWKILLLSLAGFVAAGVFYYLNPPPYRSEAELWVKYVQQPGTLTVAGSDQKVIVPDARGGDIINTEIRIMTSMDLAEQVATNLGPTAILAGLGGGSNVVAAAEAIRGGLQAAPAGYGSSTIAVLFTHPDPGMAQAVLREVINEYLQKQKEIHSAGGDIDEVLTKEVSTLGAQLGGVEQQIADLKNKANITSLDDTRKDLADQATKIQASVWEAQTDLAGLEALMKQVGAPVVETPEPVTNAPPAAPIPQDQIDAYSSLAATLEALHKKEQDYNLMGYTKSNALMLEVGGQIADKQAARNDLLKKYPQIASQGPAASSAAAAAGGSSARPGLDRQVLATQVAALKAKLQSWTTQLAQLQARGNELNSVAPTLKGLEETEAIEEQNYRTFANDTDKNRIDKQLEAGNAAPNIEYLQQPSPPVRDWRKTNKTTGMLAFGGIAVGLALACLLEFVFDRSVRRPAEIVSKLKMLLLLTIPDVSRNGHARLAGAAERRQLALSTAPEGAGAAASPGDGEAPAETNGANGALQVVSLERNPALHPFCEALRDRLIVYFEVRNLTHKPKLVAVTSANRGAGVSSIAAGLAASLSETGDGNVLLVDMNLEQGAAQQFYKGRAGCGLDTALQAETKANALVQEHLYVVNGNANSDELPRILPKRFAALVPRLKASDYDYIIFDMPPVSQTSLTSRLARFMDMVLLVVESEKSDREVVAQANHWLAESGATVGAVLNKTRRHVPARLHQEFLSEK